MLRITICYWELEFFVSIFEVWVLGLLTFMNNGVMDHSRGRSCLVFQFHMIIYYVLIILKQISPTNISYYGV